MKIKPKHNLAGRVFHYWTVLGLSQYKGNKCQDRFWDCRCRCGLVKPVRSYYLTGGYSKSCVACGHVRQQKVGAVVKRYWGNLKRNAEKRGLEFSITIEDIESLLNKQGHQCALSGLPVRFSATTGVSHTRRDTTASIDRIDPEGGYVLGNVQIVHKAINYMKHIFPQDVFVFFCKSVTDRMGQTLSETEMSQVSEKLSTCLNQLRKRRDP